MRSLSPCASRYSPLAAAGVTTFSSAPANTGDAIHSAAVNPKVTIATFFIASSILIVGGSVGDHRGDGVGHRPSLQRFGAHRVHRVARGAEGNLHGSLEVMLLELRHQPIHDEIGRAHV